MSDDSGWQPIETAPKDGTQVYLANARWTVAPIGYWGENGGGDELFGGWYILDVFSFCMGVEDGFLGWNEDIADGNMPTHWMPPLNDDRRGLPTEAT